MYQTPAHIDPAYAEFLDLFNRGRFWDSHEALEPAWRRTASEFYHALILFASAFVHVERGNRHGIAAQLGKAQPLLHARKPAYLGLDVDHMVELSVTCRQIVAENREAPPEAWPILIPFPKLDFDPARVSGDEPEIEASVEEQDGP